MREEASIDRGATFEIESGESLPIDLRTLALSLWQRRWAMLLIVLLGLAGGALVGWAIGERVFAAETTLKFASVSDREPLESDLLALTTNMNLVKIPENLLRLRDRLQLPISLQGLGAAVDASVRRNTGLLVIRAQAGRSDEAAAIANTMRDVFLERQLQMRLESEIEAIERLRLRHSEREALIDLQLQQLEVVEADIRARSERERETSPAAEGLGDINIRVERLRDAIFDDTRQRANIADYTRAELEFDKAQELFEVGVISEAELEAARAEHGRWKALAVDTEKTKAWRSEVDRLQAVALPSTDSATSPAMNVLQEMLLKYFHLRLERVELREKLTQLDEQSEDLAESIAGLEAGQGEVAVRGIRFEPLFRLVSVAVPPIYPERSNRRMLAVATAAAVILLGLLLVLALELVDTTVKSGPDLGRRLALPVLASLPDSLDSGHGNLDSATEVRFQQLAARLRHSLGPEQQRILIASHGSQEGRRAVVRRLAEVLARQELSVLIVGGDWAQGPVHPLARWVGQLSGSLDRRGLRALRSVLVRLIPGFASRRIIEEAARAPQAVEAGNESPSGWKGWVQGEPEALEGMVRSTLTNGVDQLALTEAGVPVEVLGSDRFAELMRQLAKRYQILLLAPPPCDAGAWSELLARHADVLLTVVGARLYRTADIRRDLEALGTYHRPVAGAVVTGLTSPFLELG